MSARTGLAYHPGFLLHRTGEGHAERPERLTAVLEHLARTGRLDRLKRIEFAPAAWEAIEAVHPRSHLEAVREACARASPAGLVRLDEDTAVGRESFEVALLAAGAVTKACDEVMAGQVRRAFCAIRPPGHHAETARAMGFCLFNNVAVAARHLQRRHGLKRVLIIDWDVHHGNGTQEIFFDDPSVLYFSTHQSPLYPGTGARDETGSGPGSGLTLNCPLPSGAGDEAIIEAFERELVPAARRFRPEFILVSAGFDPHAADPLAGLQATEPGFARLTRLVVELAREQCHGRVVSALEGGYDLGALARSVAAHLDELDAPDR